MQRSCDRRQLRLIRRTTAVFYELLESIREARGIVAQLRQIARYDRLAARGAREGELAHRHRRGEVRSVGAFFQKHHRSLAGRVRRTIGDEREARSGHAADFADGDRSCRHPFQRLLDVESIVGDDVTLTIDARRGIAHGGDHDGIGTIDELAVAQRLENGGGGGGGEKAKYGNQTDLLHGRDLSLMAWGSGGPALPAGLLPLLI